MVFKINISDKGKSWKLETDSEFFVGKKLGETLKGKEISADLDGYEFEVTGASDMAGFPHKIDVEGPALKRLMFSKGWGMRDSQGGLRRKKTVRGKQISEKTSQINLKVVKTGHKLLQDIFPDQNKSKEVKTEAPKAEASAPEATAAPTA